MVIVLRYVLFVLGVAAVLLSAAAPGPRDPVERSALNYSYAYGFIALACFAGIAVSALPQ